MKMTTGELCRAAGITYRMLDYWTRAGYVTPALAVSGNSMDSLTPEQAATLPDRLRDPENPGSGATRYYDDVAVDLTKRIALLLRAGLVLECSVRVARSWAEHPAWPVYLGEGLTLHADAWHPEQAWQQDYAAAWSPVRSEPTGGTL